MPLQDVNVENVNFLENVKNLEIAASGKTQIQLSTIKQKFGKNYNTINITNTSTTSDISLHLDGREIQFITSGNGVFAFDWEFGLNFSLIEIENKDAVNAIAADKIQITVGRTGRSAITGRPIR